MKLNEIEWNWTKLKPNKTSIIQNRTDLATVLSVSLFSYFDLGHQISFVRCLKNVYTGKSYLNGWLNTVDLLVLTCVDQFLLILKILFNSFTKQATLMRRSTVQSFTLQLEFPGLYLQRQSCWSGKRINLIKNVPYRKTDIFSALCIRV